MSDLHDVLPPEAQPKPESDLAPRFFLPPTLEAVLDTFKYHKPSDEQVQRISNVREGAKAFAGHIWTNVAPGPDRTVALRKLHEAMMTANKAIVCEAPSDG